MIRYRFTMRSIVLVLATAISLFSGCISSQIHPAGIEPSAKKIQSNEYEILGSGEGQSSSFNLFWLFPVTPRIDFEYAVNEAISEKGGDDLIDIRFWVEKTHWIVGTVKVLYIKGTVIRYKTEETQE